MSVVKYELAGNAESLSPALWADLPTVQKAACPADFIEVYDDFTKGGVVADTSVPGWNVVGTNADVDQVADVTGGQVILEGSGADNDSSFLTTADLCLLTRNSGKRFWFEARVKLEAATGDFAAFVGLVESTGATAELIADNGGSLIDEDYVGYFADTDGTDIQPWNIAINKGGENGLPVNIVANAVNPSTSFVKLGMKFDGKSTIEFFVNGVKVATYDINALPGDTMAHEFAVAFGVKDGGANTLGLTADWVRFVAEKFASGY